MKQEVVTELFRYEQTDTFEQSQRQLAGYLVRIAAVGIESCLPTEQEMQDMLAAGRPLHTFPMRMQTENNTALAVLDEQGLEQYMTVAAALLFGVLGPYLDHTAEEAAEEPARA